MLLYYRHRIIAVRISPSDLILSLFLFPLPQTNFSAKYWWSLSNNAKHIISQCSENNHKPLKQTEMEDISFYTLNVNSHYMLSVKNEGWSWRFSFKKKKTNKINERGDEKVKYVCVQREQCTICRCNKELHELWKPHKNTLRCYLDTGGAHSHSTQKYCVLLFVCLWRCQQCHLYIHLNTQRLWLQ